MKIIYISFLNEFDRPGYKNKIHSQVRAFERLGNEAYLYTISGEEIVFYRFKEGEEYKKRVPLVYKRINDKKNIIDEMIIFLKFIKKFKEISKDINPDIVYIRRIVPITPWLINLIKWLRKQNIYVAYEYPTYPWKRELLITNKKLFYYIDSIFYRYLLKQINQLVCFGAYNDKYYSSKVIETMNGVDVEKFKINRTNKQNNKITLIAVGHIMPQHGYDKIIKGLEKYYNDLNDTMNKKEILVHIVGPQGVGVNLEDLAKKYNVEKYVKFWGFQTGDNLEKIFEESNMGIDCLALNRIDSSNIVGSLKSREYLARGLPFIFAGNLDIVRRSETEIKFLLELDENQDYVNFVKVIDFYEKIEYSCDEIRDYAEKYLSWEKMMKPVIEKYLDDIS